MRSAVQLFDVFNRVPSTERRSILDQLHPGMDHIHPTDIPLIHRLRWILSKTRSITLDIPLDQRQYIDPLEVFQQLDAAMEFFDLPRFWSEVMEFNVHFDLAET
jgi:hypothetical protein